MNTFLRARAEAAHAPIVVLTGLADEEVAARAVREGAQDYLVKAEVDGPLLYRSIRYAVERNASDEAIPPQRSAVPQPDRRLDSRACSSTWTASSSWPTPRWRRCSDSSVATSCRAARVAVHRAAGPRDGAGVSTGAPRRAPGAEQLRAAPAAARRLGDRDRHPGSSIAWEGGQATLATVVDMTERQRAEQGLRTSEERFRQIAENIKEAFIIVELDGLRPLYLSRMWEEIWGRPLEEAYRDPAAWVRAIHPDDAGVVHEARQAIEKGERSPATSAWCGRTARSLGPRARLPRLQRQPRAVPPGRAGGGHHRSRRTEEQLLRRRRWRPSAALPAAWRTTSTTCLTAILGYSELVLQDLGDDHPSAADVKEIRAAGQSAESLTRSCSRSAAARSCSRRRST
jgi:hypothetical protein